MQRQYSRDQAIAQARIPKYASAREGARGRHEPPLHPRHQMGSAEAAGDPPPPALGRRGPRRPIVERFDILGARMIKKRVSALIAARGSNMESLPEAAKESPYPAEIVLVVS